MRYECEDEAFAGDFVELSDSWSRAQSRAIWAAAESEDREQIEANILACLRPKIIALHLTCVDAPPITAADELTPERTEQVDLRLYRWFAEIWWVHLRDLASLGNALGRRLYTISVPAANGAEKETAVAL
jgi:hypothetical protein